MAISDLNFLSMLIGPLCEDGAIRLADGPNANEGRVEICYQNVWGAVYDEDWTGNDTAVVCSQLGFGRLGQSLQLC